MVAVNWSRVIHKRYVVCVDDDVIPSSIKSEVVRVCRTCKVDQRAHRFILLLASLHQHPGNRTRKCCETGWTVSKDSAEFHTGHMLHTWARVCLRKSREIDLRNFAQMGNSVGQNSLGIPQGKGPHQVGCTDLMVGHTVQGSFFRLYYPCQASEGSEEPSWIPCREYFNGLADFMKMSRALSERIFNYLFGSYKIPAAWNASFKTDGKYPVVIFSHGLGAFRTLYSAICVELASQGFIVAAVEHRDESASATFYYKEKSKMKQSHHASHQAFQPVSDNLVEEWMYYRPLKTGENEFLLRNNQVKQRADECIRALELLIDINSGNSVENTLQSEFDWSKLKNSMDLCRVAVMGHSFGGATVIECLFKEVKFKCGVALDTWMLPLNEEIFQSVKQPIFFINSEKFQWAGNIIRMKKLDSAVIPRKMITIMGAVHQSFPDFTFLTGNWIGKMLKLKGEIDPQIAMDLCKKASLAFLQRHLSLERDFNQWDRLIDGKDDHLIPGTNVILLQSSI